MKSNRGPVTILGYHRVVEDFASSAQTSIPSLLITVKMLERHLDWIGSRYHFVGLNELDGEMAHRRSGARPAAAITFDDGYRDFYELAFPLLKRKGIPAALFVVTDLVGTTKMQTHDALYYLLKRRPAGMPLPIPGCNSEVFDTNGMTPFSTLRRLLETLPDSALKVLIEALATEDPLSVDSLRQAHSVTWEMIAKIHQSGFVVGSHTRAHVLMPNETESRVAAEALCSKSILEERLGAPVRHFAFPSGSWNSISVKAVAAAKYHFGYTTCHHRSREYPLLTIPRTLLWERSCLGTKDSFSGPVLSCLVEGAFDLFCGCRQSHTGNPMAAGGVAA
jgi:peptidoglycan/xylan/chitin deacetylase (PgdA/CDA1 family)